MDLKGQIEPLKLNLQESRFPRMVRIRQTFDAPILASVPREVWAQTRASRPSVKVRSNAHSRRGGQSGNY